MKVHSGLSTVITFIIVIFIGYEFYQFSGILVDLYFLPTNSKFFKTWEW